MFQTYDICALTYSKLLPTRIIDILFILPMQIIPSSISTQVKLAILKQWRAPIKSSMIFLGITKIIEGSTERSKLNSVAIIIDINQRLKFVEPR